MKIAQHSLTLWCPQARPVITSVGLVAWIGLVGCGDAGGASASDSASASASSGSTTAGSESEGRTTSESGTVSDSATAATTGGSISDSNDVTSAPTTSDSATATGTTGLTEAESVSGSDSTVGTSTEPGTGTGVGTSTGTGADTEGVNYCGDAPPPGYGGPAEECLVEPEVGTFKPVVEWTKSSWVIAPTARQIVMTPVVGPLTDDDKDGAFGSAGDIPAIVVVTFTGAQTAGPGVLRAISGDGETELFDNADEALWGGSGAAIGDLDGDGEPEIVALAVGGVVKAFTRTGALKWKSAAYPAEFAASLPQYSSPAIADMDGDGKAEVIAGRLILNSDGTLRGKGAGGFGGAGISSASFAADVDGDGVQEVVVGNALYRPNGTAIWSNGQPDGFPAVADFDGDGKGEIVVTSNGSLRLQGGDGAVIWSVLAARRRSPTSTATARRRSASRAAALMSCSTTTAASCVVRFWIDLVGVWRLPCSRTRKPARPSPAPPATNHLRLAPRFHPAGASNGQESVFCPVPGRRRQGPPAPPRAHGPGLRRRRSAQGGHGHPRSREEDASAGEPAPAAKTAATAPQIGPKSPTIREFACRFEHDHIDMYLKPGTAENYRSTLRLYILPALGDRRSTRSARPTFSAPQQPQDDAVRGELRALRAERDVHEGRGVGGHDRCRNPVTVVKRFKERAVERFLSPDERQALERVLAAAEHIPSGQPGTSAARRSGPCACWP
jgi:hypothetical protein